jgi:uncharacterized membrane protein YhaH (DUF805 family)
MTSRDLWFALILCVIFIASAVVVVWRLHDVGTEVYHGSRSGRVHLPSLCRVHYGTPEWVDCMGVGYVRN